MGAVRMRVQTADKNITIIHTTPVHQLISCEAHVCKTNPSRHFSFKPWPPTKIWYNNASSFWRHPFTAQHPLVSKWCNATFLQICSDEETNSSTSCMSTFSANFHFWVKLFIIVYVHAFRIFFYQEQHVFSEAVLACMNAYLKTSLILHTK